MWRWLKDYLDGIHEESRRKGRGSSEIVLVAQIVMNYFGFIFSSKCVNYFHMTSQKRYKWFFHKHTISFGILPIFLEGHQNECFRIFIWCIIIIKTLFKIKYMHINVTNIEECSRKINLSTRKSTISSVWTSTLIPYHTTLQ